MRNILFLFVLLLIGCKQGKKSISDPSENLSITEVAYAKGFHIERDENGIRYLHITSPWPDSETKFVYALVPGKDPDLITQVNRQTDAIIHIPVKRLVVTSTTHIPSLEALGVADRLIGFPETKYISSPKTRKRIDSGEIEELGSNDALNTEMTIATEPDLVVGFGIANQNKAYAAIESAGIPVVYNGDWTEETPLGKAEWIKFFAVFFGLEEKAEDIFKQVEKDYLASMELAKTARSRPKVLSGALYKDVWYLPAGESWAARFMEDANADYLWKKTSGTGSLSLSLEAILEKASDADVWISPSQFTAYDEMEDSNDHYLRFKPFKERKLYTFALSRGATGGLLYYELAPSRPDIVLKDLIQIFHPELLPEYEPYFFKPLQ